MRMPGLACGVSNCNDSHLVGARDNYGVGTRWVMPKNLGTAQEVSFSADPAHV